MEQTAIQTVLVAGLGLIGGSMAKAIKENIGCRVLGWNRTRSVAERACAEPNPQSPIPNPQSPIPIRN